MTSYKQAHSGNRPVIAIIGNRNAGKSSLLNRLTEQDVSIVSDTLGTTTDAVMKAYELIPAGAVTFYDTAGLDDEGALGKKRIEATDKIISRADVVVYVIGKSGLNKAIEKKLHELHIKGPKLIPVANFSDNKKEDKYLDAVLKLYNGVHVSAKTGEGIENLRKRLADAVLDLDGGKNMLPDFIQTGDTVVLVTPIDEAAPKGRLIMPEVQALRELLDKHTTVVITQPQELAATLKSQHKKPTLVITDSQAIKTVAEIVPEDIPLTTFSVLMARAKWNLAQVSAGIQTVQKLQSGDKILIAEGCSHRMTCHDIGRTLIPSLLEKCTGKKLAYTYVTGNDFLDDLSGYKLVVHCGGCMLNQKEIERRLELLSLQSVAVVNYGMLISYAQGSFERVTAKII